MLKSLEFASIQLHGSHSLTQGCELPKLMHHVGGEWVEAGEYYTVVNPLTGEPLFEHPDAPSESSWLTPFVEGLGRCPTSGLHNPLKNPDRLLMLGEVCFKAACVLQNEEVAAYFAGLIQRVMPKSFAQCMGEVTVTRQFLKNSSGDGARFLLNGETTPGDHTGQEISTYHWPYGSVVIVAPFNFPLEIPALQLVSALLAGNRPTIKAASTVAVVIEQFLRLLFACGLPREDVDLIHCSGSYMEHFIITAKDKIRQLQFTGSSSVAETSAITMRGKIAIEDAGFNWKIFGPDFNPMYLDWVAYQCDQDAYAASGQKCSAQSITFVHDNWGEALVSRLKDLARARTLGNLTIGPVLTWKNDEMLEHVAKLAALDNARVLFGGNPLKGHNIPDKYGAIEPTAVFVPLDQIAENFDLVCTEVFGPVQVVTNWSSEAKLVHLLGLVERMEQRLTAAVVSNSQLFTNRVLAHTVNGTTYVGMRARTTGAPQNHWFGPAGDPRSAGIGSPGSIIRTWTSPRCIVKDVGPAPEKIPEQS